VRRRAFADLDAAAGQAEMAEQRGGRAPRMMSARPPRNTAAETARIGRAGNNRSFMGLSPPEAADLERRSLWLAVHRQLSLPWSLTRREGSASAFQNLKADFATNGLRIEEFNAILFPVAGSSPRPARADPRGVAHFEPNLSRREHFI
jgi:hypothetical protein